MAAHGTMSGSDRERLRQEWMQHSAQALERMFAQEQQAGLIPFTQREDRELVSRAGTVRLERERYRCTTCRVVFFPLGPEAGTEHRGVQSAGAGEPASPAPADCTPRCSVPASGPRGKKTTRQVVQRYRSRSSRTVPARLTNSRSANGSCRWVTNTPAFPHLGQHAAHAPGCSDGCAAASPATCSSTSHLANACPNSTARSSRCVKVINPACCSWANICSKARAECCIHSWRSRSPSDADMVPCAAIPGSFPIRDNPNPPNHHHINQSPCKSRHAPDASRWLAGLGDVIYARLAAVGLVKARENPGAASVGKFVDDYLAQRGDLRAGTLAVMKSARRTLVAFLGEGKALADVSVGDADAYRAHLLSTKAKATTNKWCRYARHYFEVARRRRMILENPFAHIRGAVKGNASKRLFIPARDVQKVIDVCPDPQWKLLIGLARWGGLRIPSEALALTWRDVDFEHSRFTVRASKTAHHEDGGIRVVPMFPDLAPLFQAVYDAAPDGTLHVIARFRDAGQNLRTQFERYIIAAGLKPWCKPWQNLRVSRATELADVYPSHVCAAWLGHTARIADEFYQLTTVESYKRETAIDA